MTAYAQIQRINQQHGNRDIIQAGFEYFGIGFTDLRRCSSQHIGRNHCCSGTGQTENHQLEIAHLLLIYSNLHTKPHKINLAERSDRQRINQMRTFVYDIVH